MKIQFLYWEECPSHGEALIRLREVLKEAGVGAPVDRVHVETDEQAVALEFPGSPTIRIDGVDLFPVNTEDIIAGLTCRVYHTPDGRATPLPTKDMLRSALGRFRTEHSKGGT